jgi:hypothetical protein
MREALVDVGAGDDVPLTIAVALRTLGSPSAEELGLAGMLRLAVGRPRPGRCGLRESRRRRQRAGQHQRRPGKVPSFIIPPIKAGR